MNASNDIGDLWRSDDDVARVFQVNYMMDINAKELDRYVSTYCMAQVDNGLYGMFRHSWYILNNGSITSSISSWLYK